MRYPQSITLSFDIRSTKVDNYVTPLLYHWSLPDEDYVLTSKCWGKFSIFSFVLKDCLNNNAVIIPTHMNIYLNKCVWKWQRFPHNKQGMRLHWHQYLLHIRLMRNKKNHYKRRIKQHYWLLGKINLYLGKRQFCNTGILLYKAWKG